MQQELTYAPMHQEDVNSVFKTYLSTLSSKRPSSKHRPPQPHNDNLAIRHERRYISSLKPHRNIGNLITKSARYTMESSNNDNKLSLRSDRGSRYLTNLKSL